MVDEGYICKSCGNLVEPNTKTKGSFWLEVLLWMLFIIPGLLYSLSRLSNKTHTCPICGKETVIPLNTPIGRKLLKELKKDTKNVEVKSDKTKEKKPTLLATKMTYGVVILVLLYAVLLMLL